MHQISLYTIQWQRILKNHWFLSLKEWKQNNDHAKQRGNNVLDGSWSVHELEVLPQSRCLLVWNNSLGNRNRTDTVQLNELWRSHSEGQHFPTLSFSQWWSILSRVGSSIQTVDRLLMRSCTCLRARKSHSTVLRWISSSITRWIIGGKRTPDTNNRVETREQLINHLLNNSANESNETCFLFGKISNTVNKQILLRHVSCSTQCTESVINPCFWSQCVKIYKLHYMFWVNMWQ